MSGYQADIPAMARTHEKVTFLADEASTIRELADQSTVPGYAWGIVGQLTVHSKYVEVQKQFQQHIDQITGALKKLGSDIGEAGKLYEEIEQRVCDELTRLHAECKETAK